MQWGCYSSLQEILKYLSSTNDNKGIRIGLLYIDIDVCTPSLISVCSFSGMEICSQRFPRFVSIYNNYVTNAFYLSNQIQANITHLDQRIVSIFFIHWEIQSADDAVKL